MTASNLWKPILENGQVEETFFGDRHESNNYKM